MNKYFLVVLMLFSYTLSRAQSLPRSIKVGAINVKYDSYAKGIIEKEIQSLNNNRKYLDVLVDKMALHFPVIEKILADAGIPDEIKYLCVQESVFDPDAISISGAVGYWQFKSETAKEIGLRVDGIVDERKHLAASTKAAAIYLNRSNSLLNNWMTTVLSYRIGQGAIKNHPATDWANKKEITVTNTTDWYLLRFLAHRYLLEIEYNKVKNNAKSDFLYEYSNSRGKSITEIANELSVAPSVIAVNNVWLKSSTVPKDKDYIVYVPMTLQKYKEMSQNNANPKNDGNKNSTNDLGFPVLVRLTQGNSKTEPIYFEINGKKGIMAIEGDTPESIANRADINLHRFLKYNDLDIDSRIIPNEVYYLKKKDHKAMVAYHTVQDTETLWAISQMYGIYLEDLMAKNRIASLQRLQRGRLLWLIDTRPDTPIQYVEMPKVNPVEKTVIISTPPKQVDTTKSVIILDKPKEVKPTEVPIKDNKPSGSGVIDNRVTTKESTVPVAKDNTQVSDKTRPVFTDPAGPPKIIIEEKIVTKELKNHTVLAKDTYFSIAQLYDMKIGELLTLNDLRLDEKLRVGQVIKVYKVRSTPISGAYESEKKLDGKKDEKVVDVKVKETTDKIPTIINSPGKVLSKDDPANAKAEMPKIITKEEVDRKNMEAIKSASRNIHTVNAGETLFSIAKLHGVTVADLRAWNDLTTNTVEINQQLWFSKNSGKLVETSDYETVMPKPIKNVVKPSENNIYHIMKVGETVFKVSQIYGVTVEQIVKWNNLKNFSVSVGQRILIKK
ncbi:LysM peptidoglycan-binding domain-containing protein [Arcicella aquatica]|uniref:LysM peptidoglycan-binding domain-containing protein n=1 Tax=Arcicella aquatica TaxID=217141 RepID=A0ABU5QLH6_9BACT|nr:LysM peptidoglycan-binding domain-containing protein [Arcicella aquatica]MEA5257714.1 LysM peptidoglycan-binding domain-containing protein [Arcicella aquatica]